MLGVKVLFRYLELFLEEKVLGVNLRQQQFSGRHSLCVPMRSQFADVFSYVFFILGSLYALEHGYAT
jgi:hypothetical protein